MVVERYSEGGILVQLPPEPETTRQLKDVSATVRGDSGCNVIVDFSQVDIVTSSSLGELLRLRKLVIDRGRRLVLCGMAPLTKSIFTVTALERVFEFAEDMSAVLARV